MVVVAGRQKLYLRQKFFKRIHDSFVLAEELATEQFTVLLWTFQ